jgi:hypothetical protein
MERQTGRLIPHQRVNDEGLHWADRETVGDDGEKYIESIITDAAGAVYHGILDEDGGVSTAGGYGGCDSVETYHADLGRPLWKTYISKYEDETLYHNEETGAWYCIRDQRNGESYCYRVTEADLLRWLPTLPNNELVKLYNSKGEEENFFVKLPAALVWKLSWRDIVETLSKALEGNESSL